MGVICINCGWENPEEKIICDKCKQPLKRTIQDDEIAGTTITESFISHNNDSVQYSESDGIVGNRYKLIGPMCQVGSSIIFDTKDIVTDESFALIMLADSTKKKYFLEEYKFLKQFHLPGVLYPYVYGEDGDKSFYISDWVNDVLSAYCGEIDFNVAELIFAKIATLLNALHSKNIILGSLSTDTILVGKNRVPYIAPSAFLSVRYDSRTYAGGTFSLNKPNLAPEFYTARGAKEFPTQKGDIWALGAIMYELITKEKPFIGSTEDTQYSKMRYNPYFQFYSTTELDIMRLRRLQYIVARCLDDTPSNRPSPRFIAECFSLRVIKSQKKDNLYAIIHPIVGVIYTIIADKITPFTAQCVPGPGPLPPMSSYFMGVRYENGNECGYLRLEDSGLIVKSNVMTKDEYKRLCQYT